MNGLDFGARMRACVARLATIKNIHLIDAELGAPLEDAELARVESRLGFALDPRFVAYFREMNGARVAWVEGTKPKRSAKKVEPAMSRDQAVELWVKHRLDGGLFGAFHIPRLDEIFSESRPNEIGPGTTGVDVPILGGWKDEALRARLRIFDRWEYLLPVGEGGFDLVTVVAAPGITDPVLLRASDQGAALSDHRPMRARSYLEMLAVTAGGQERFLFLRSEGAPGDHPIVELDADDFGPELSVYDADAPDRSDFASEHLRYALSRAGLRESEPRPERWIETPLSKKFAPKVRTHLESLGIAIVEQPSGWVALVKDEAGALLVRVELSGKLFYVNAKDGARPEIVAAVRTLGGG